VRWDNARVQLSQILHAVQEIGYLAYPFDTGRQEELFRKERNTAIRRLAIAGLGMMQVMMYAVPVYLADEGTMTRDVEALMRFASLLLTIPVVFYSAWPFFQGAWRDLKLRRAGMDVPVALGVGFAFAASLYGTFTGSGEVYFDSITMFVFFLLTGRFLEMNARKRSAESAESLVKLIPAAAVRLPGYPGSRQEETVGAVKLTPGDHVLVGPGESFPADGTVEEGASSVDESLLTGESRPVDKHPASPVIGGTLNLASPLVVRVEKVGADTVLSGIVRLLDRALAEKPRLALVADRVAGWFVLGLLLVAAAVGITWYVLDPDRAFWITVSVLVVSCPCAGGVLPLRPVPGHAGRPDRGPGPAHPHGAAVHPRPCPGNPGPGHGLRVRQDRHAHHRGVQAARRGHPPRQPGGGPGPGLRPGTGGHPSRGAGPAGGGRRGNGKRRESALFARPGHHGATCNRQSFRCTPRRIVS